MCITNPLQTTTFAVVVIVVVVDELPHAAGVAAVVVVTVVNSFGNRQILVVDLLGVVVVLWQRLTVAVAKTKRNKLFILYTFFHDACFLKNRTFPTQKCHFIYIIIIFIYASTINFANLSGF